MKHSHFAALAAAVFAVSVSAGVFHASPSPSKPVGATRAVDPAVMASAAANGGAAPANYASYLSVFNTAEAPTTTQVQSIPDYSAALGATFKLFHVDCFSDRGEGPKAETISMYPSDSTTAYVNVAIYAGGHLDPAHDPMTHEEVERKTTRVSLEHKSTVWLDHTLPAFPVWHSGKALSGVTRENGPLGLIQKKETSVELRFQATNPLQIAVEQTVKTYFGRQTHWYCASHTGAQTHTPAPLSRAVTAIR